MAVKSNVLFGRFHNNYTIIAETENLKRTEEKECAEKFICLHCRIKKDR